MNKRLVVMTTLAVALGGCGGDGGGSTGPVFSDSVSAQEAGGFALGAQWLIGVSLQTMNGVAPDITPAFVPGAVQESDLAPFPAAVRRRVASFTNTPGGTPGLLAALFSAPPAGCTSTARGTLGTLTSFVDNNGNGIPDDYYVKQDCIYRDSASDTTVMDHSVQVVQVKEDAGSLFGYTRSITFDYSTTDGAGTQLSSFRYAQSETTDRQSTEATHSGRTDWRSWELVDGVREENAGGFDFSATFTPTGAGATIPAAPDSLPDGKLAFTGHNYQTNSEGRNLWFGLSTPVLLTYSPSCAVESSGITFGTIKGILNDDATQATFTTSYDGCDGYSTNYTGTKN